MLEEQRVGVKDVPLTNKRRDEEAAEAEGGEAEEASGNGEESQPDQKPARSHAAAQVHLSFFLLSFEFPFCLLLYAHTQDTQEQPTESSAKTLEEAGSRERQSSEGEEVERPNQAVSRSKEGD